MKKILLISIALLVSLFALSQSPVYATVIGANGSSRIDILYANLPVSSGYMGDVWASAMDSGGDIYGNSASILPPDDEANVSGDSGSRAAGFQSSSAKASLSLPYYPMGSVTSEAHYHTVDPLSDDWVFGYGDSSLSTYFEVTSEFTAVIGYYVNLTLDAQVDEYGLSDILCAAGLGIDLHDPDDQNGWTTVESRSWELYSSGSNDEQALEIPSGELQVRLTPGEYCLSYGAYTGTDSTNEPAPEPIPEPTTLFLLGTGFVGMAGYGKFRFRRKKK